MKALILGAGGFIGHHLVKRLKNDGYFVKGVDIKMPEFEETMADDFIQGDLRDFNFCKQLITSDFDEVYQLAADMGGAGYLFSGNHDFDVMNNSAKINLNVSQCAVDQKIGKVFFSSSACIYPIENQLDPNNPNCIESSAYPANPDSEYGWEKLFSERIYLAANRNYNLDVRIARFHNVYGPLGAWNSGKEKVPAAICRKVAQLDSGGSIEIWGDGCQTRSFLFIDDCINGILKFMQSDFIGPVNIGSEEMVSINQLAKVVLNIADKEGSINHIDGPIGVNGRTSDNKLVREKVQWEPEISLKEGIGKTYAWIFSQLESSQRPSTLSEAHE
ncbi:MAG: GDP-D-mannose 3',5'-epimerase [Arenicella sp.]|jgi:GDP-D-mannose 3',5'-epimerase